MVRDVLLVCMAFYCYAFRARCFFFVVLPCLVHCACLTRESCSVLLVVGWSATVSNEFSFSLWILFVVCVRCYVCGVSCALCAVLCSSRFVAVFVLVDMKEKRKEEKKKM